MIRPQNEGHTLAQWDLTGQAIQKSWKASKRAWTAEILRQNAPFIALLVLVLWGLSHVLSSGYHFMASFLSLSTYIVCLCVRLREGWRELNRATSPELELLDDAVTGEAYPVEIAIIQDKFVTGRDRGVLWGDRHRLGFHGHRTSFVLTAENTRTFYPNSEFETHDDRMERGQAIPILHNDRNVSVRIMPLKVEGDPEMEGRFEKTIAEFRDVRRTKTPYVTPPLSLQPNVGRIHTIGLLLAILTLPISIALAYLIVMRGHFLSLPSLGVLLSFGAQAGAIRRFIGWRRLLKKLRAEEARSLPVTTAEANPQLTEPSRPRA